MSATEVVILGMPPDEDHLPEEARHNCDALGCGSIGSHVIYRSRSSLSGSAGKEQQQSGGEGLDEVREEVRAWSEAAAQNLNDMEARLDATDNPGGYSATKPRAAPGTTLPEGPWNAESDETGAWWVRRRDGQTAPDLGAFWAGAEAFAVRDALNALRPGSAPAEEREELAVMTIGEVKKLVTHAMAVYAEGIGRAMAKMGLFQFTAEALLREAHEQGEAFDRGEWALSEGTRRLINSDGVGALVDASGFSRSRQQEQQQAKEGEV